MSTKFEPSKQTINDLYFNPGIRYRVPKYQRPYSWDIVRLESFLDTILENRSTFIGTVVYNTVDPQFKEIIDGQQRYLTITILAAALRNLFLEEEKKNRTTKEEKIASHINE